MVCAASDQAVDNKDSNVKDWSWHRALRLSKDLYWVKLGWNCIMSMCLNCICVWTCWMWTKIKFSCTPLKTLILTCVRRFCGMTFILTACFPVAILSDCVWLRARALNRPGKLKANKSDGEIQFNQVSTRIHVLKHGFVFKEFSSSEWSYDRASFWNIRAV